MAYDEMGNYTGYDDEPVYAPVAPTEQAPNSYDPFGNPVYAESEEERRKREEEERKRAEKEAKRADETAVQEQKVITYENGSKTIETKQEIPAGQRVPGPVKPGQQSAINRAPMDANQAYTAQMESGGRQNIGYHNPGKGTAYGTYGITAPAYAEIQKNNPKFAGRPITSLTPEEQGEAYQTLTRANQGQLSRLGVEPTPANQRLAHFLGASGAAKFLQTGQISDAAAKANGGLEKAIQIAQQRLAGTMGPGYGDRARNLITRGLNAIIPSAQASEVPRQEPGAGRGNYPGMPQAKPEPGVAVATGYGVQGTQETPAPVAPDDSIINNQVAEYEQRQQGQAGAEQPSKYSLATGRGEPGLRYGGQTEGRPGGESGETPAQSGIRAYSDAQDNVPALMKLGSSEDPNVPDFIKERARNRAADLVNDQRETKKAVETMSKMEPTEMAKYLASKKGDDFTTRVRALMYARMGNQQLAARELDKLESNAKDTYMQGADGKPYLLKMKANGEVMEGYNAETGEKLNEKDLVRVSAGAGQGKWQTSAEFFQDKAGNVYQTQHNDKGQTRVVNVKTNERYTGEAPLERLRDVASATAAERQQGFRRENDMTAFGNRIKGLDYKSQLDAVAEARKAAINRGEPDFTDAELANLGITRPALSQYTATGKITEPSKPAQGGGAAPAPAAQGGAPAAPAAPAVPGKRETVEEARRREKEEEVGRAGRKEAAVTAGKVEGGIEGKELTNKAHAKEVYDLIRPIQTALKDATGSGLGTKVDEIAAFFGGSTKGAEASAQLKVLGSKILMNVPRFEGPQSDKDTAAYKEAAGNLADSTLPIKQRSAALKTIIDLNKKYAPDLDWDFNKPATREKQVGGVTYVYDGKGWKPK